MRITVQVVIENDGQSESERHEIARLDRGKLDADTVGLQLAEAKQILANMQEVIVAEQVSQCVATRVACPDCGRPRRHKDARTITLRTAFACKAHAGITAPASRGRRRRSARWRRSSRSEPRRSCSTSSPSSPA